MYNPTIVIIGCGFIGSHLADELPKLFFSQDMPATFRFIDYDEWEHRNAANQNVSGEIAQSGENKAVTCARYASMYPGITAEAIPEKLVATNAQELLTGADLIIDAVDNIPTRQILWGFAKSGSVCACMHTGISRQGDGIINWSSPNFDTFPFKPGNIAGRKLKEQDIKEPPCEMYRHRTAGVILVQGIAKAAALFMNLDPWGVLEGAEEQGMMTCWNTNLEGCKLLIDDVFLVDEFFPVYNREA